MMLPAALALVVNKARKALAILLIIYPMPFMLESLDMVEQAFAFQFHSANFLLQLTYLILQILYQLLVCLCGCRGGIVHTAPDSNALARAGA